MIDSKRAIDLFNQMQIEEVSAACGEIEYILVINNNKNIDILHKIGITDKEIEDEGCGDYLSDAVYIDISPFAFKYANGFDGKTKKFYLEERLF